MFGQFIVAGGGGYDTRQGLEELSEAALSVVEAAKLGISWSFLIAFLSGTVHLNVLFYSDTCLITCLNNFLTYNSKNLYNFFSFVVPVVVPPSVKKITSKLFSVIFWGNAKYSPL